MSAIKVKPFLGTKPPARCDDCGRGGPPTFSQAAWGYGWRCPKCLKRAAPPNPALAPRSRFDQRTHKETS